MTPTIVEMKSFQVVGLWTSTSRDKEQTPDAIIAKEWKRFLSENLLEKIPDRIDQQVIAVYTDFATDARSQYSFILGAKVRPVPNPVIPEGMVVKTVPAGKYAVFATPRGPAATVIPETWKRIRAYFAAPGHGERAYLADFDVYKDGVANRNDTQVDIYVGVK